MKKILLKLLIILIVLLPIVSHAQVQNPVKWEYNVKSAGNGVYTLHFTATINKGWHIYSQTTPEGGPVPTAFVFVKNPLVSMVGVVKEVGVMEKHNEPLFGVEVKQYADKVDFVQTVKVKPGIKTNLSGSIEFMLCNNKECLPPAKQEFSIALK